MVKFLTCFLIFAALPVWAAPPHDAAPTTAQKILLWPRVAQNTANTWETRTVLHYLLRHAGFYKSAIESKFGPRTTQAIQAFQKAHKLTVDGIAGPQTWGKLIVRLKRGDKGDAVRAVQIVLKNSGVEAGESFYDGPLDGVFGFETERALREWQQTQGLEDDGIAGPQTWCVLVGGKVKDPALRPE